MRFLFAALGVAVLAVPAQAQDLVPDATATRIDDTQVRLQFTFEGGACQELEAPASGGLEQTTQRVVLPTRNTADMCTMQVVPIAVDVIVKTFPEVTTLDVQVLSPSREVQVQGTVPVGPAVE